MKNGDFVLGTSSWYARYWHKAKIDYLVTEDIKISTEKIDAGYQLVVPVNNKSQSVRIMSEPFKIAKGELFKCELTIRVEGSPRNINLHILNAENDYKAHKTVGNKFETIELNGKFPSTGNDYYRFELYTDGAAAKIFIKSAELLQKASSSSVRTADFPFAARALRALSLYEQGYDVVYDVHASVQIGRSANIGWIVTDLHGENVASGKVALLEGLTSKRISLGKLPLGWYSVSFVEDSTNSNLLERHSFAVIPKLSERVQIDPENSFFGTHTEITSDGLLAAKLLGFHWIRLNSPLITKWNAVEENKGVFTYNDKAIAELKRQGFGIVGTLDRTALWASTGKTDPKTASSNYYGAYAYLPENWNDWAKYVTSVVTHYRNDIQYWEIWNEPDIPFLVPPKGATNASAYDTIVRKTAPLVRLNNPKARLLGGVAHLRPTTGGPGRQLDFLEEMAKLKTQSNLDIFTIHYYVWSKDKGGFEARETFRNDFEFTSKLLGTSKLSYWQTEFGFVGTAGSRYEFADHKNSMSTIDAASQAVKYNVTLLSAGVAKIFLYNLFFDTNGYGEFKPDVNVMWDNKEPRPVVASYAYMTQILDGLKPIGAKFLNGFEEYTFTDGKKNVKVVWSMKGSKTYTPDQNTDLHNMFGRKISSGRSMTLTDEPVYVIYYK